MIEVSMWNKSSLYAVSSTDDLIFETTFYKSKAFFSTFLFRVGFLRSDTDKKIFHDLYLLFFFITKWVIVKKNLLKWWRQDRSNHLENVLNFSRFVLLKKTKLQKLPNQSLLTSLFLPMMPSLDELSFF